MNSKKSEVEQKKNPEKHKIIYRVEWLLYSGHIRTYGHKLTFHINMSEQFSSIALLFK